MSNPENPENPVSVKNRIASLLDRLAFETLLFTLRLRQWSIGIRWVPSLIRLAFYMVGMVGLGHLVAFGVATIMFYMALLADPSVVTDQTPTTFGSLFRGSLDAGRLLSVFGWIFAALMVLVVHPPRAIRE